MELEISASVIRDKKTHEFAASPIRVQGMRVVHYVATARLPLDRDLADRDSAVPF